MRHIVILLTFLALACSPVFAGQTIAEDVKGQILPRGSYVPGELIIHGASPLTQQNVVSIFQAIGIPVTAIQLSLDGTYFLIRLRPDDPRSNSRLPYIYDSLVDYIVCENITGNPGEGPMTQVDGIWPNYVLDPGDEFVDNTIGGDEEDICLTVSADDYNPLGACPDHMELPNPRVGDRRVKVAVMDTGLDPSAFPHFFNDLRSGLQITHSYPVVATDYLNDDPEGQDVNGHGTAVAALIAHRFYEVRKLDRLQLLSFQILNKNGLGTVAALINALDQAIHHEVDIINLSLGFVGEECDEFVSALLAPLFTSAGAAGILIFTSAGNDGNSLAEHAQYPANSSPSFSLFFTVGASSCGDETTWSGSNFDVNIVDFTSPGQDIIVPYTKLGCYIKASGTSFAAPLSASIAAALRTEFSVTRTVCVLESRLMSNYGGYIPGTGESRLGSITYLGSSFIGECLVDDSVEFLTNNSGSSAAFPNPVGRTLNIPFREADIAAEATLRLIDLGGRVLLQTQVNSPLVKLSTGELPAGVYILSVTSGENIQVTKIIKR